MTDETHYSLPAIHDGKKRRIADETRYSLPAIIGTQLYAAQKQKRKVEPFFVSYSPEELNPLRNSKDSRSRSCRNEHGTL
jgi:hypothetical protein